MKKLIGSICLSDIPKSEMKKVKCRDGKERTYVSIAVVERKEVADNGDTHFITCEPKKELRREGVRYIFGNLRPLKPQYNGPSQEEIENGAPVEDNVPIF